MGGGKSLQFKLKSKVNDMIREIVQVGDPVLRRVCEPVTRFDGELAQLLDDMKETLKNAEGAGLAAPQVGVPVRAVGFDVTRRCRFDEDMLTFLKGLRSPKNRLLSAMTQKWIADTTKDEAAVPTMHDPLTVATLFDETLVRFARGKFSVCLNGADRGMTLPDENGTPLLYARDADIPRFMTMLRGALEE